MAGHSHWAGIKHKKGRADKERSKIFSKLSREITVAAKLGDKDPDMNPRLRTAIQAAKQAQTESKSNSSLVGVTILTSLNDDHLKEIGFQDGVKTIVSKLSSLAKEALLDGVVCSVEEVKNLKKTLGDNFLTVTPGIRVEAKKGDQNRCIQKLLCLYFSGKC